MNLTLDHSVVDPLKRLLQLFFETEGKYTSASVFPDPVALTLRLAMIDTPSLCPSPFNLQE